MTVAHELAERGFEVDLFERHEVLGGKVRSFSHPETGIGGRADLPGSMGGHFFVPLYSNLGDTLSRIPIGDGRSVLDNLTIGPGRVGLTLAWETVTNAIPIPPAGSINPLTLLQFVASQLQVLARFTPRDVVILASKIVALITSGEKRQWDELEHLAIGDYLQADLLSVEAKVMAKLPGFLGLANAEGMNARACGRLLSLAVNTLCGHRPGPDFTETLSLLNGPENEAWFDPWASYLQGLGTRFHLGHAVTDLACANGRITGATVRDSTGRESLVEADWYVLAVPPDKAAALMNPDLVTADPALGRIANLQTIEWTGLQIFLNKKAPELRTLFTSFAAPWETGNEVLTSAWCRDLPTQYGDGQAVEYISVQLTDATWKHLPGMVYGKPAKDCSRQEIIDEILAQLRRYLPDGDKIFADSAIHSLHLCPGLIGDGSAPLSVDEPLFAASPSCWQSQPDQHTKVANFFLAGSYTRNIITGDTMDGASESGRRAANAVLAASDAPAIPVDVVEFSTPRWLRMLHSYDDRRHARGLRNVFDVVVPTRSGSCAAPIPRPRTAATSSPLARYGPFKASRATA